MIARIKDLAKRHWPALRLRTILFAVLLFAAAMPALGAIFLRSYENTLVRQTEAELVAQGAALAAATAAAWPGAPLPPPAERTRPGYYHPEPPTIDLRTAELLPERPPPRRPQQPADLAAKAAALAVAPVIDQTTRTTLASAILLDRQGVAVRGPGLGGDFSDLPEVRSALGGQPQTVLRRIGDYRPTYRFEWLSRAANLRLHHARPIEVGGQVQGVLLLSRSPRPLFRGLYEDRVKIALGAATIFGALVVLAGLVSRGVTRPIEGLSAAARRVAEGGGDLPPTPRTAAIEIRALYEDFRAMADAIERRSGYLRDFAAAVSHEFKTPLAGIRGAVELLQDHGEGMSPDERRRFLSNAAEDADRLSRLVSRLLDLARADMARPGGDQVAEVSRAAERAAEGFASDVFEVRLHLPPGLPPVAAPAATLDAVLAILLQNSRQAGASVATVSAFPEKAWLTLRVADDGPGAPKADQERLFEPFFTSRRAEGGTGLGLPIARSLLAASHADIQLVPTDQGAVFQVRLRRADS